MRLLVHHHRRPVPATTDGDDAMGLLLAQSPSPSPTLSAGADAAGPTPANPVPVRLGRLAGAVDRRTRRDRSRDVRRFMNTLGMATIGFGIAAVILGWFGAAHSPYLAQEIPYLISGGILGLALVVAGGVLVLSGWSLRQIQEQRRDTVALNGSLRRIESLLASEMVRRAVEAGGGPEPEPGPGPGAAAVDPASPSAWAASK